MVMDAGLSVAPAAASGNWFFANNTFAAQLAQVPHGNAWVLSGDALAESTLAEPTATALVQMFAERVDPHFSLEAPAADNPQGLKEIVVGRFNGASNETRRVWRALGGFLWAEERLADRHPHYDRSLFDFSGFPGRDGKNVGKLLENSGVGYADVEPFFAQEGGKESLALEGPRDWNLWHAWNRWRGQRLLREGFLLEFVEGEAKARKYFYEALRCFQVIETTPADEVMAAALREKVGCISEQHEGNGTVFENRRHLHRAAAAFYQATVVGDFDPERSEDFFKSARLVFDAMGRREKEETYPASWNFYFHSAVDVMMALHRFRIQILEKEEAARAFAEAQEAYGTRWVGMGFFGEAHRRGNAFNSFPFWFGARHLFEAALTQAMLEKDDRAETALTAGLRAMTKAAEVEQREAGGVRGRSLFV